MECVTVLTIIADTPLKLTLLINLQDIREKLCLCCA